MKKVSILFVVCLITATISAQITRTIVGITLGTTYKSVLKTLKQNNDKFIDLKEDGINSIIISNENFTFAGVEWTWPSIEFKDGKVSKIQFTNKSQSEEEGFHYVEEFESLSKALYSKYQHYAQKADFHEVENGAQGYLILSDGKTEIELVVIQSIVNESALQLLYEDISGEAKPTTVIDEL